MVKTFVYDLQLTFSKSEKKTIEVVLMCPVPHRKSICSPDGGDVWRGCQGIKKRSLLEEVGRRPWDWRMYTLAPLPVRSLLHE